MTRVKVISFTAHPDTGWAAVTPAGLVTAERAMQVTIIVSETWDDAARAVRELAKPEDERDA